ncbi:glycogen/starch synthase [Pseudomonas aeruginosa]
MLFVTAELSDSVKVGGLGDFSGRRAAEGPQAEHSVRVLLPGYARVLERCRDLRIIGSLLGRAAIPPCEIGLVTSTTAWKSCWCSARAAYEREGHAVHGRPGQRDWPDNHLRFSPAQCLAAAEIAGGRGAQGWQARAWCTPMTGRRR